MSETKPFDTCSVSRDDVTMDHEGTCLDHVIKTEELDLKPDCIDNTDVDREMAGMEEQTDDCGTLADTPNDISNLDPMDAHTNIETRNEILSTENIDNSEQCYDVEVEAEISRNDALELLSLQEIPSGLITEIKIEEMDESDSDIFVREDKMYITEVSSAETKPKAGVSNTSDAKSKSKQESEMYMCNECNYKCATRATIVRHFKTHMRIHSDDKSFSCKFCEYKCAQRANLTVHIRTHTGEKPFSCAFCDYKCARKTHLTIHIRTHTGEKPFSCEFCDYKGAEKSSLIKHLRIHTGEKPFTCDFCEYKCAQRANLTVHIRKHTGEKPFRCEFCDCNYARKSQLLLHLRIHTQEKPLSAL